MTQPRKRPAMAVNGSVNTMARTMVDMSSDMSISGFVDDAIVGGIGATVYIK